MSKIHLSRIENPIRVNKCYYFSRALHVWDGVVVVVLSQKGKRYRVARASDKCEHLLDPLSTKRPPTWTCTYDELY